MRSSRIALSLVVSVLFWFASVARSDETPRARELFEKGTTLYDLGKYLDAAHAYEEAYALKNDAALLFNIGQSYRLGGDYSSALRAYKSFLRRVPDAPNRGPVAQHIVTLQKLVDDQKRASTSPPSGTFAPGQPMEAVHEPPPESRRVEPTAGPSPTLVAKAAPPHSRTPLYKRWWLWTTVAAVVAASVGVGVGLSVGTPRVRNAPAPAGTIPVSFP